MWTFTCLMTKSCEDQVNILLQAHTPFWPFFQNHLVHWLHAVKICIRMPNKTIFNILQGWIWVSSNGYFCVTLLQVYPHNSLTMTISDTPFLTLNVWYYSIKFKIVFNLYLNCCKWLIKYCSAYLIFGILDEVLI